MSFSACRYTITIYKKCWQKHLATLEEGEVDVEDPTQVCSFGCQKPRLPTDVFMGLRPIPLPCKLNKKDDHFQRFDDVYGKTPDRSRDESSCPSRVKALSVPKKLKKRATEQLVRARSLPCYACV